MQVADYEQFKKVVRMLNRGYSKTHTVYTVKPDSFTIAAFTDNTVAASAHKCDCKPTTFDHDFPDAVEVLSITWG
jgi:hypothetical protein